MFGRLNYSFRIVTKLKPLKADSTNDNKNFKNQTIRPPFLKSNFDNICSTPDRFSSLEVEQDQRIFLVSE